MANYDNPVTAVFGTAELLEAVLLRVNTHQLLFLQRVDRTFNATIAGSHELQRALWLDTNKSVNTQRSSDPTINPLLDCRPLSIDSHTFGFVVYTDKDDTYNFELDIEEGLDVTTSGRTVSFSWRRMRLTTNTGLLKVKCTYRRDGQPFGSLKARWVARQGMGGLYDMFLAHSETEIYAALSPGEIKEVDLCDGDRGWSTSSQAPGAAARTTQ